MPNTELVLTSTRSVWQRFVAVGGRLILTIIALLVQLFVFIAVLLRGSELSPWVGTVSLLVSLLALVMILNSRMQIEYKLAWTIPILLAPLFGGAFYLLFGTRTGTRRQLARYHSIQQAAAVDQISAPGRLLIEASAPGDPVGVRALAGSQAGDDEAGEQVERPTGGRGEQPVGGQTGQATRPAGGETGQTTSPANGQTGQVASPTGRQLVIPDGLLPAVRIDPDAARQVNYLASHGPFVAYRDTETTYFPVGEDAFEAMLEALEAAQRWIAMEYFIVADGVMWRRLFDVLARKARDGVQVWFLYDDIGSLWRLPGHFIRDLTRAGIRVQPVNKFGPGFTLRYNNRDHRKLTIVDGLVGFTGGLNIADEYINELERFGHWKDTSIRLRGPGAWGLAMLFFSVWDLVTGEKTDVAALHPSEDEVDAEPVGPGIVLSYDDTPFDDLSLGWGAYRNLMTRAHHHVDLMTPYLVPTGEMIGVFTALATSGVRVRLITPGIPDKPYVYSVTRSNYQPLVEAGVEVYEYSPGFLHAKQMVVDDETAIIGTINFDFRSFYLHQENAVWMHQTSAIADMAADFEQTVALSRRITLADVRSTPWWQRAIWLTLRTFSPLM